MKLFEKNKSNSEDSSALKSVLMEKLEPKVFIEENTHLETFTKNLDVLKGMNCSAHSLFLEDVNHIIAEIVSIDTVDNMILGVEEQIKSIKDIDASANNNSEKTKKGLGVEWLKLRLNYDRIFTNFLKHGFGKELNNEIAETYI